MSATPVPTGAPLDLGGRFVEAVLVGHARSTPVVGRAIVVNPSRSPITVDAPVHGVIPAFSSTILADTAISGGESVLMFRVPAVDDAAPSDGSIGGIVREPGWARYGDLPASAPFPADIPLWRGPVEEIGTMEFDPSQVVGAVPGNGTARRFRVTANLWFAPQHTDCFIHRIHDFVEIHTQIHGYGRMQKFRAQDHSTLYEDLAMSPGYTTPVPFCETGPGGGFTYPWHQYRADSDCVWLAIEYHDTGRA